MTLELQRQALEEGSARYAKDHFCQVRVEIQKYTLLFWEPHSLRSLVVVAEYISAFFQSDRQQMAQLVHQWSRA